MNRIGSNTGSFAQVLDLNISGLENITYYPILSSVAGILIALISSETGKTNGNVTIKHNNLSILLPMHNCRI